MRNISNTWNATARFCYTLTALFTATWDIPFLGDVPNSAHCLGQIKLRNLYYGRIACILHQYLVHYVYTFVSLIATNYFSTVEYPAYDDEHYVTRTFSTSQQGIIATDDVYECDVKRQFWQYIWKGAYSKNLHRKQYVWNCTINAVQDYEISINVC